MLLNGWISGQFLNTYTTALPNGVICGSDIDFGDMVAYNGKLVPVKELPGNVKTIHLDDYRKTYGKFYNEKPQKAFRFRSPIPGQNTIMAVATRGDVDAEKKLRRIFRYKQDMGPVGCEVYQIAHNILIDHKSHLLCNSTCLNFFYTRNPSEKMLKLGKIGNEITEWVHIFDFEKTVDDTSRFTFQSEKRYLKSEIAAKLLINMFVG